MGKSLIKLYILNLWKTGNIGLLLFHTEIFSKKIIMYMFTHLWIFFFIDALRISVDVRRVCTDKFYF